MKHHRERNFCVKFKQNERNRQKKIASIPFVHGNEYVQFCCVYLNKILVSAREQERERERWIEMNLLVRFHALQCVLLGARVFCLSKRQISCVVSLEHVKLISIKGQMNLFAQWLPMNMCFNRPMCRYFSLSSYPLLFAIYSFRIWAWFLLWRNGRAGEQYVSRIVHEKLTPSQFNRECRVAI